LNKSGVTSDVTNDVTVTLQGVLPVNYTCIMLLVLCYRNKQKNEIIEMPNLVALQNLLEKFVVIFGVNFGVIFGLNFDRIFDAIGVIWEARK
jgi:hypothetical protein